MGYLGENIRRERVRAGFDQARLASELELDQTAISRFENGSRRPSVDLLKRIAAVLGCAFSSLTGEADDGEGELLEGGRARDFVTTLLEQNPQIGLQLRSLTERSDELEPEDWQFLADHLSLALNHVEKLRAKKNERR